MLDLRRFLHEYGAPFCKVELFGIVLRPRYGAEGLTKLFEVDDK